MCTITCYLLCPSFCKCIVSIGTVQIIVISVQLDQLQKFHAKHYHPTNGHFYTYGDMPLATHLQRMDEEFLSAFEKVPKVEKVLKEPRWDMPVSCLNCDMLTVHCTDVAVYLQREHQVYCGVDPMLADPKKCATVGLSFLLAP